MTPFLRFATVAVATAALLGTIAPLSAKEEAPTPPAQTLKGNLVELRSGKIRPLEPGADPLEGVRYFLYYYSAGWSGECNTFAPKFARWYKNNKKKHPEFEVILISHDGSAEDLEKQMKTSRMPWPAVRYDKKHEFKQYDQGHLPCLVVVNEQGKAVTLDQGKEGKQYKDKATETLEAFEEFLKNPPKPDASPADAKP